jgi:hypothetical protein
MGKDMRKWLGNSAATALLLLASSLGLARAAEAQTLGTISVDPMPVDPSLRASLSTFVDDVDSTLADKGFTTIKGPGHARFVAELSLTRTDVGTTTAKVSVAGSEIAPGGFSSQVGGGVTVMLPTAKVRTVPLQQTRLEIRIKKRGEDAVIWHGAALTVRAAGQDRAISADLAKAILRTYPEQAEGVASVP